MSPILQFSLGPVQEFVAQSRKTRDLLCSSFLLSFLSGQAMASIIEQGGRIRFPTVHQKNQTTDPLLLSIQHVKEGIPQNKGPWVGSIPNRFQAEIPDDFAPEQCVEAVQNAWQQITSSIWEQLIEPVADWGHGTEAIWERQVRGFWEIQWVIGSDPGLLHRRKYWRNQVPTSEGGDKCMLLSHLQELSGYVRSKKGGNHRIRQEAFWEQVRHHLKHQPGFHPHELKETERLSAIGMIKRCLPLVARETMGWDFPPVAKHFPSTHTLALFPWCRQVLSQAPQQAEQYARMAKRDFPMLHPQASLFTGNDSFHPWGRLDPQSLREELLLENPTLAKHFSALCQEVGSEPAPYYALLLMDGDQLGQLLQQANDPSVISQALAAFTSSVESLVGDHHGALIYAGGDDVFALFPCTSVLRAAIQLRHRYQQAFQQFAPELRGATLSAGVVFTHQKTPFQQVIPYGHHLLDAIAKEHYGRNSLAVGIYSQRGELCHWGAPWEKMISNQSSETVLERLAEVLDLSSSYLVQCKQRLEPLAAWMTRDELMHVAIAEWERVNEKASSSVREAIGEFIDFSMFSYHQSGEVRTDEHSFSADGAQVIRWFRQWGGAE